MPPAAAQPRHRLMLRGVVVLMSLTSFIFGSACMAAHAWEEAIVGLYVGILLLLAAVPLMDGKEEDHVA